MSKASLELGGGNWAAKDGKLLGYAVGDTSGKYLPREFTFSRGADIAATRVNKDGLIEKYRENLLLQSNQFDTTWSEAGSSGIITSGFSGYDGTNDAWQLEHKESQFTSVRQTLSASGVQTYSVYAKAGTLDYIIVYTVSSVSPKTWFNLSTGQVGTKQGGVIDASMESVGNGWYRCSIVFNDTITEVRIYPNDADVSYGTTPGTIYIQDAQLEYGLVATDYIESGSSTGKAGVLDNLPRIDYTSGSAQLLMEPSRTNKLTHSEYFGNWSGSEVDLDLGYEAPDGTNSAYKISITGGSSDPYLAKSGSVLSTDSRSIWAKTVSGTGTVNLLTYYENTNNLFTITNDWQRFEISSVTTSTGQTNFYAVDFRGDSTLTEVLIWGAQAEEGSYATSYIPTYGAQDTRAAEGEDKDSLVTELPSELSGGYTLFMDFEVTGNEDPATNYQDLFDFKFDNASSKSAFRVETFNSGTPDYVDSIRGFAYKQSSSSSVASVTAGDILMGSRVKLAATFDDSYGVKMFYNGSKIKDYAEVTSWEKVKFIAGAGSNGNTRSRTLVNQILAYPTVLSEAECENLTTI